MGGIVPRLFNRYPHYPTWRNNTHKNRSYQYRLWAFHTDKSLEKYTFVAEIVDAKEKVIWKSSGLILGSNIKIVENPLIIKENVEEVPADSNIKDSNIKDETTSQDTITPQPTETSNAEKTFVEDTSVADEPNSTDIILPTHVLSSDSGLSILPFQRHIWSEEVEISVKKSPGIATLIISEKNTGHVFIRSTLEIR